MKYQTKRLQGSLHTAQQARAYDLDEIRSLAAEIGCSP